MPRRPPKTWGYGEKTSAPEPEPNHKPPKPLKYWCSPCCKRGTASGPVPGRWYYGKWWCFECIEADRSPLRQAR